MVNKAGHRGWGHLRQRASGRWQASYVGPDAARHHAPHTFDTSDDATVWLVAERRRISEGTWVSPEAAERRRTAARLTFEAYSTAWLAGRTLKPRTREHYRSLLDRQLRPTFGELPLTAITPAAVRDWHALEGTAHPTLRAHAYGLLRTILGTAVTDEIIAANPCTIRGAGAAKRKVKIQPATLDELATIHDAMPERFRLAVLLSAWCALRFGELAELRRGDVDIRVIDKGTDTERKVGVLKVRRGVTRVKGETIIGTPKTSAGIRDVTVPPHLIPAIEAHLKVHAKPEKTALLFPAENGGNLAPSTLYRAWYPAREAAGRPDLRWHDLRHLGAVLAAQTGATLAELMGRLGHSSPAAAMRYQHVAAGRDAAIADALSVLARGQ